MEWKVLVRVGKGNQMADLQITNLLGEGGFAKVFRGLWQVRGLMAQKGVRRVPLSSPALRGLSLARVL